MDTETANESHSHSNRELCAAAIRLYEEALRKGRIARAELAPAPCLIEMALLHPDPQDDSWMRPVPPSAGLAHLLQPITREIEERVQLTAALSRSLAPLVAVASEDLSLAITILEGKDVIHASLKEATAAARNEVLTAQPGSRQESELIPEAVTNAHTAIDNGARLRHIYQHPARYSTAIRGYLEQVPGDRLKVRTIEQTVDRLIIFDRKVAFIPATPDRNVALEIRNPAIVRYLIQVYEMLWAQAVPFTEQLPTAAPGTPVTAVQRSIARLLAEGHVDDVVARKLGISVRTCRAHIAKLMQALGASSRTHLGALLVRSGIVEAPSAARTQEARHPDEHG